MLASLKTADALGAQGNKKPKTNKYQNSDFFIAPVRKYNYPSDGFQALPCGYCRSSGVGVGVGVFSPRDEFEGEALQLTKHMAMRAAETVLQIMFMET